MGNLLHNAGFLDGIAGWQGTSGLTLAVDETTRGAAGRMVLKGTGNATASGHARWLSPTTAKRVDVSALPLIEVFGWAAAFRGGTAVPPDMRAVFYNSGGTAIQTVPLTVRPPVVPLHGVALAGLKDTYWSAYDLIIRPANAVRVSVEAGTTSTASQTLEVLMLKPFVGAPSARHRMSTWGPGAHDNTDLSLRNWPSDLEIVGSAGAEAKPWAIAHDAGAGLPSQRRTSADPARKLACRVRADVVQRATLEAFCADEKRFWFVEPDTEKVCKAGFDAQGAPRLSEARGGLHYLDFTLWLETF